MTHLSHLSAGWPTISALLDEALELEPARRAAWLDNLTGEPATYRETLWALLQTQAQVETGDFLVELPLLPETRSRPGSSDPTVGDTVGPYRLIRPLGRGGMADVWLAERGDGTMQRQVALKLPRRAWGDAFADRLTREREILASLEHEHIARLYDAGVDEHGRPFLAMQYTGGEPIDVYCHDRALPLPARIALLLQVMDAVSYAHSKLVVHRDLKPGNILVTDQSRAVLLDFGVAKLLEGDRTRATALTELSGRALTLDYASPEQIRGEAIGTASDVYSMAVVAYELLVGVRPYRLQRDSAAALEEAIASAQPPLASATAPERAVRRQLRGDLDAILNRALKKDPIQRYASMQSFADDMRRHLEGRPVEARPDGLAYRVGAFVRRHRLQAAAGAVALAALIVGSGVAFWQAHESRLQAERARTEAATAEAVRDFLEAVFRTNSGDQDDAEKVRNTTARELLDRGAERIDKDLAQAPRAKLQLLKTLAEMYTGLTLLDKAADLQHQRAALARALDGPSSSGYAQALADSADALAVLDRRDDALRYAASAGAVLDALSDRTSAARFSVDHALALIGQRNDPDAGLAAARRAVANARGRGDAFSLVSALQVQSEIAASVGEKELARDGAQEAIGLVEADPRRGANNLSPLYVALADAQFAAGATDQAETSYRRALAIALQRNSTQPIILHTAERRYGSFLRRNGRLRESMEMHRPGYEWARGHADGFGVIASELVVEYGRALLARGRVEEGLGVIDEALAMQSTSTDSTESRAATRLFRAQGLIELGRLAEAKAEIALAQKSGDPRVLHVSLLVGPLQRLLLVAEGHPELALQEFEAARVRQGKPAQPAVGEPGRVWSDSATLQFASGHLDVARAQARHALDSLQAGPIPSALPDLRSAALFTAGRAALAAGDTAASHELLSRSLDLRRQVYDPEWSLDIADTELALATALNELGSRSGASRLRADVLKIRSRHPRIGSQHPYPS